MSIYSKEGKEKEIDRDKHKLRQERNETRTRHSKPRHDERSQDRTRVD